MKSYTKKKWFFTGLALMLCIVFSTALEAADLTWKQENPFLFLDEFAHELNLEDEGIQENSFNNFDPRQWQYASQYRFSNALDTLRIKIAPYIQRTMYISLSFAVIAIIYNGLMLVLRPAWIGTKDSSIIKKRIGNILLGVFILVGFYVIVEIILALLSYLIP